MTSFSRYGAATLVAAAIAVMTPDGRSAAQMVSGWSGSVDGSWHWRIPPTPNGLQPSESWHAISSAPDGQIYVAGMDHQTNSALYRIDPIAGTLRYLGDARAASEAASNWQTGETAQKFHTRPTWHGGKVYVATMDDSQLDDSYLSHRGFHWYAYDPATGVFSDVSAGDPDGDGVGAPHLSVVTLASDPARNLLYGAAVPTAEILQLDVATNITTNLGRPTGFPAPYTYTGRFLWMDSDGRLYFTVGNGQWPVPHDPERFQHVHYVDPDGRFGERTDWQLAAPQAIEMGRCSTDRSRCLLADDQSRVYAFDAGGPTWSYLGQAIPDGPRAWVFQVSPDFRKAYVITGIMDDPGTDALYEIDIPSMTTRLLCPMARLDPGLAGLTLHTGYDAWDAQGRFYIVSFPPSTSPLYHSAAPIVTAIDPARLKAALAAGR